jgi:hydrogenase expression/formation protein HypD
LLMRHIDEYRDAALARQLLAAISRGADRRTAPLTIMEICGSHTHALSRFGIRPLLPENIRLISGPGCPICVTSVGDIEASLFLAREPGIIFTAFGDMLRVPGTGGISLQTLRASGADIRVIASPTDAVALAENNPGREILFMGIGFETTTPAVAAAIAAAGKKGVTNLSLFSAHKSVPPAIGALLRDPLLQVDGFLCPGHVSTIIGADAYWAIPDAGRAAVITGFEPVDILAGILMIIEQCTERRYRVEIQYRRAVSRAGNPRARQIMRDVFEETGGQWRGLGDIPESGLALRQAYRAFDARQRFAIPLFDAAEPPGCACGDILRGIRSPDGCPLFRTVCTPLNPVGPCMVSSEGTCSAYFKYH